MDQIGTSHITLADLIVCGVAILLILRLKSPPRNTALSAALAILCGCIVVAIITILLLVDLKREAVWELSMIALFLCVSLWDWNNARVRTKDAPVKSPEFLK